MTRNKLKLLALALAWGMAAATPVAGVARVPDAPATEQQREAAEALSNVNAERLMSDRDYAAEILRHLDQLESAGDGSEGFADALDNLRLVALTVLERREQLAIILDRRLASQSRQVSDYGLLLFASLSTGDYPRTVNVMEAASRNVPGVAWGELHEVLPREEVMAVLHDMKEQGHGDLRSRLAEALYRIGWPGRGDTESSDFLRSILVDDRLGRGDMAGATGFARMISGPGNLLPMLVQLRYDPLLEPGDDRLERFTRALADRDRETREALQVAPDNPRGVLDRVQHLRSVARDDEALILLDPYLADVAATVEASEEGSWLLNEAAYALIVLERPDEARALMEQVVALPLDEHPGLISQHINHATILLEIGDPRAALEHATQVEGLAATYASEYGKMWVDATIVCSLAQLARRDEAAPRLERMRGTSDANPAALVLAYLCAGDDDAAARLMVERLESDDPATAILAMQEYRLSRGPSQTGGPIERLVALGERPEVRAALARVGRVLPLPLTRSYWGGY